MDLEIPQCIPLVYRLSVSRRSTRPRTRRRVCRTGWPPPRPAIAPRACGVGGGRAGKVQGAAPRAGDALLPRGDRRQVALGKPARQQPAGIQARALGCRRFEPTMRLCTPLHPSVRGSALSPSAPPPLHSLSAPSALYLPGSRGISTSCRSFTTVAPCH